MYDAAKGTDYDILPIETTLNLFWKSRESFKMKYGATQAIKSEDGSFSMNVKEC